jgi:hypothetical protein
MRPKGLADVFGNASCEQKAIVRGITYPTLLPIPLTNIPLTNFLIIALSPSVSIRADPWLHLHRFVPLGTRIGDNLFLCVVVETSASFAP